MLNLKQRRFWFASVIHVSICHVYVWDFNSRHAVSGYNSSNEEHDIILQQSTCSDLTLVMIQADSLLLVVSLVEIDNAQVLTR